MAEFQSKFTGQEVDNAIDKLRNWIVVDGTYPMVTISGVTYAVIWKSIPISGTPCYGIGLHPTTGRIYEIYYNGSSYTATALDTDTKNTAGSTNSTSKLFLVGAGSQAANPQTFSNGQVYTTDGTLYATTFYENGTALSSKYQAKGNYLPLSGGSLTGDLALYTASGDSPRLTFQRGKLDDALNDWSLYDGSSGYLYIQQRGQGSTEWETRATFSQSGVNFAGTISEDGKSLANKYLGKTAKAADADKLDGNDSTYYLNLDNINDGSTRKLANYVPKSLTSTKGDMIYASDANTPARLAIGSNGQFLSIANGAPAWVNNPNTDTHYTNYLQIKGNGTEAVKFEQNANKTLNLKPGTNVSISAASGEITINSTITTETVSGWGYVKSSGVTSVATSGTGISGGTITSTGTITLDSSSAGNATANKVVIRNAAGSIQTEKLAVSSGATTKATMQYNSTEDCIEFIFA